MGRRSRQARAAILASAGLALSLAWPAAASAQQQQTWVQLPTFSFFTVNTTVSVPDSGGAFLGGIRQASSGYTAYSPGPSRARGSARAGGGVSVHATIHDFVSLDADQLAERRRHDARDRRLPAVVEEGPLARRLSAVRSDADDRPALSVADIRRRRAAAAAASEAAADAAARELVEQGEKALAGGKPGAARVYFQMAARRASGELKEAIQDRLADLSSRSRGVER